MKKRFSFSSGIVVTVAVIAVLMIGMTLIRNTFAIEKPDTYTDGVVRATFNEEAGTLTFSGNGAVDNTQRWLKGKYLIEQKALVRAIIFEDGITNIGDCEFDEINSYINLEEVIFQGDINRIGGCAFAGNTNLRTVEFGGECRQIDELAFFECVSLTSMNVPNGCAVSPNALTSTPLEP